MILYFDLIKSIKMNWKLLFQYLSVKLLFTILCSGLLFLQTWQITEEYLKKNSVTNIRFTRNLINTLPAITICYDELFSFEKVVQRFKQNETSYKNYTNLIKRIDEIRMKYNENETRDQELEDKYLEESKFYHDIYEKIIWDIFTTGKIPFLRDMFENFSLPFKFIEYGKVNKSIFIGLSGELIGDGDFANYFTYDNITKLYYYNLPPLESIYYSWASKKCFTYFSSLKDELKNFRVSINKISISIRFPLNWFPFSPVRKVLVALHSPNVMPSYDKFDEVEQATKNKMFFSKVENNEFVDYGRCFKYDNGDEKNFNKMKSDCVLGCLYRSFPYYCWNWLVLIQEFPTRKELLPRRAELNGTCYIPGNGNDQNFQGGVFSARGGYFGFSAQGGYIPPSGKTGSSAFSVI